MRNIFHSIIEGFFWLLLLLSRVILVSLLLFVLNSFFEINNFIFYSIIFLSVLWGIFFAQKIKKKYGCSNYWSRIYSTPDFYPTPIDDPMNVDSKKGKNIGDSNESDVPDEN